MFILNLELQSASCSLSTNNVSQLATDFSQHGSIRAVNQDIGNKVTGVTYLKKPFKSK